ncbi:MAG TPA: signal peptidase II [Candidatus Dormibacteraeota bacterium]|nr:signal peptidase II [Candidatus Dormibacteraeota bacterium]
MLAAIAAAVVIVDRITKIVVERRFGVPYGPRQILDHVLFLTVTRNAGAAFGIFQNFTLGFLVISTLVMIGILIYYWRLPASDWSGRLGLALVFGGAIANAYDRAVKGSVVDFIQVPHWPIFNVADSAVTVGVTLLLLGTFWANRRPRRA